MKLALLSAAAFCAALLFALACAARTFHRCLSQRWQTEDLDATRARMGWEP